MAPLFALLAAAVVLVVSTSSVAAAPQPQNVASLGNGNINTYLQDGNLVMSQINCLKGTGHCNRLGQQLTQAVKEVLNNRCGRCTQAQSRNARKLIDFVKRNYPSDYNAIQTRFMG